MGSGTWRVRYHYKYNLVFFRKGAISQAHSQLQFLLYLLRNPSQDHALPGSREYKKQNIVDGSFSTLHLINDRGPSVTLHISRGTST